MEALAYAKLNLTLDVLYKRPDGYHELDMLNIRVSLADTVALLPAPDIAVAYDNMPVPENDTVTKAIASYSCLAGCTLGAHVKIRKRIPAEAGLGGGSADAAAVLQLLQHAYGALSDEQLQEAALRVGADVPYCLFEQPCRVGGVGEKILPLPQPAQPLWFLLLKPALGISTPMLFSCLQFPVAHPDTAAAVDALRYGDTPRLGTALQNALQPAAVSIHPEIGVLQRRLLRAGALGAAMSGSGSALFGLFLDESAARAAIIEFQDVPFRSVCRSIP